MVAARGPILAIWTRMWGMCEEKATKCSLLSNPGIRILLNPAGYQSLLTHSYLMRCYPRSARARREERGLAVPNKRERSSSAPFPEAIRRKVAGLAVPGDAAAGLRGPVTSRLLRLVSSQSDHRKSMQCSPIGCNCPGVPRKNAAGMTQGIGLHVTPLNSTGFVT